MSPTEYRFGPSFVLRPATRELLAGGQPQRLGARAFDLLVALVERDGGIVTRDELFDRAWPGRAVIDDNLKVQVMGLRRLLGAEAIVTVPGHGYRFGWPVQRGAGAPGGAVEPAGGAAPAAGSAAPPAGPDPTALIGREPILPSSSAAGCPGNSSRWPAAAASARRARATSRRRRGLR
ncbi:MAG: winged helix-turn-helix domain-containing protein [Rubrivivax sp.]|nr:winged helix-turn-helix domain-containing protein [Rubrivivax sp.]